MIARIATRAAGALVALALRALGATWRIERHGSDPLERDAPFLGVIWHAGLFCAAHRFRDRGIAIAVSQSRDGDRIDAVLMRLGFGPSPRGSSSRGGVAALAGLIRTAREGRSLGLLCDGPRGPARVCKPGVVAAARATGLPVFPIGIAARPALRFPSWDRTFLPLPFARVVYDYAASIEIPREVARDEVERWRERIEKQIAEAQSRAEARLATRA
jgi:lysophospholipid acyltransferase (LPLAT)-like uncharacterized protein